MSNCTNARKINQKAQTKQGQQGGAIRTPRPHLVATKDLRKLFMDAKFGQRGSL